MLVVMAQRSSPRAARATRPAAKQRPSPSPLAPSERSPARIEPASKLARSLAVEERAVLDEAIVRAARVYESVGDAWSDFGRWLFTHVFGEDTKAAIEHREDNPVWQALVALADGAKVRLRQDELERAVLTAAYDKRLNSDAWRALEFGRKWRLLKLADDKLLRQAAQHVLSANLDTRAIDVYVRRVLEEQQNPVTTRVHVGALISTLDRMQQRLKDRTFARQLESAAKKLTDDKRDELIESIIEARDALDATLRKLERG
jgi:hypothetical protein